MGSAIIANWEVEKHHNKIISHSLVIPGSRTLLSTISSQTCRHFLCVKLLTYSCGRVFLSLLAVPPSWRFIFLLGSSYYGRFFAATTLLIRLKPVYTLRSGRALAISPLWRCECNKLTADDVVAVVAVVWSARLVPRF